MERTGAEFMGESEARDLTKSSNKYAKAAGFQRLADLGVAGAPEMKGMLDIFGETSQVFKQMQSKVKTYDPTAAFSNITNTAARIRAKKDFVSSNQFDAKKIKANSWKDAEFQELALTVGNVNNKDMEDVIKRNPVDAAAIKAILTSVADTHVGDNDLDKAIQLTNFAQTGKFSPAGAAELHITNHVFSKLEGETGANIDKTTMASNIPEILGNIKPAKLVDFARNIKDIQAQKLLLSEIKRRATTAGPRQSVYEKHAGSIQKDASLAGAYASA